MKYRAIYLDTAKHDVSEIRNYLSQFYPGTPNRFLTALKKGVENICDNPFICPVYEDNPAYRKMVVLDYLVFYKILDTDKAIEIRRILHGMRDIRAHLPKPPKAD